MAGNTSRYSRSMDHMPLYSMRTCLGLYCFSHSLHWEQVRAVSLSTVTTVTLSRAFCSYSNSPSSQQIRRVLSSRAKPSSKMPLIKSVLPPSKNPAMRYTGISAMNFFAYRPNSSASFSSFRLEPMTHRRPV